MLTVLYLSYFLIALACVFPKDAVLFVVFVETWAKLLWLNTKMMTQAYLMWRKMKNDGLAMPSFKFVPLWRR